MTLNIEFHLGSVNLNQHAKYLGQKSFCLKLIIRMANTYTTDWLLHLDHKVHSIMLC